MTVFSDNKGDYVAIIQTVLDYAQGVAAHDLEKIKNAFDIPKAQMKLLTGSLGTEKVYVIPIEKVWNKIWSGWPNVEKHHVEVSSVTIHEKSMATVFMNNNDIFSDELSLYKINGAWKIYDKLTRAYDGKNIPEDKLAELFGAQE